MCVYLCASIWMKQILKLHKLIFIETSVGPNHNAKLKKWISELNSIPFFFHHEGYDDQPTGYCRASWLCYVLLLYNYAIIIFHPLSDYNYWYTLNWRDLGNLVTQCKCRNELTDWKVVLGFYKTCIIIIFDGRCCWNQRFHQRMTEGFSVIAPMHV